MKDWEKATPDEAPQWFCGNAEEWDLVRRAVDANGWSRLRRFGLCGDDQRRMKGSDEISGKFGTLSNTAFVSSIAVGIVGTIIGTGTFSGIAHGFSQGMSVLATITGFAAGGMVGGVSGMILGGITSGALRFLGKGKMEDVSLEMERLGDKRISQLRTIANEAQKQLYGYRASHSDEALAERVSEALCKVEDSIRDRKARERAPAEAQNRMEQVAKKLRSENPQLYTEVETEAKKGLTTTLEGRLALLGEVASDGLAAVALWNGMGDLSGVDEAERKAFLSDRIPRLLTAFEAVPERERRNSLSILDGETPEGSFRRGLRAALDSALATRKVLTERAAIGVEAEARVMERAKPF